MRFLIAIVGMFAAAQPSFAQHMHGKGPNGGPVEDVVGINAELVAAGNRLTIFLHDEKEKPVPSKGFSGAALVASNGGKETVTLEASGENALQAETKISIVAGSSVTLNLKNAEGKTGQAKFRK